MAIQELNTQDVERANRNRDAIGDPVAALQLQSAAPDQPHQDVCERDDSTGKEDGCDEPDSATETHP